MLIFDVGDFDIAQRVVEYRIDAEGIVLLSTGDHIACSIRF